MSVIALKAEAEGGKAGGCGRVRHLDVAQQGNQHKERGVEESGEERTQDSGSEETPGYSMRESSGKCLKRNEKQWQMGTPEGRVFEGSLAWPKAGEAFWVSTLSFSGRRLKGEYRRAQQVEGQEGPASGSGRWR